MPPSPVEELSLLDLDRSNKGASKQRRDQINAEIATMRDLLPLPESARQRLSQLQIMSLSCVYIRKCNLLQKLFRAFPNEKDVPSMCDFFQALTGFLLITTREGKLVYISENVTDYLGHSMVDMKTQGDSLYDIVDKRDHGTVQAQLLQGGAELDVTRDVAFFCRMNMSRTLKRQAGFGDVKVMHVRGHFIPLSDPDDEGSDQQQQQQKYVFMATCSPLITPELKENLIQSNTMVFKTVHQLDMTFLEVTKTAEYHLGYSTEQICQTSWYSMLHPEDIHEAREKHILLIRSSHEMGCMLTVRMLSADRQLLWVNIVMHVRQAASAQNDDPLIVCINQVISEEEAYQIRVQSHIFALYPPRTGDLWTAGMSAPPTQTQHSQADSNTHWLPTTTGVTAHDPGSSYQNPASYYMPSQQCHTLPACSATYPSMQDRTGYQINPSSPTLVMPPSQGQSDKLKLMLKRKIQGPCRPAKLPKLAWDEHTDGSHSSTRQGMDYATTADPVHSPDSTLHFTNGNGSGGYSWSASTQVIPRAQYRAAHVLPVAISHQHQIKSSILSPSCPSAFTPSLSLSASGQITEQVVPENRVAVPDSYLTPDPSPVSSPQPHTSNIKTESVDCKMIPTSAAILQLEKLASFRHADNCSTRSMEATVKNVPPAIKAEKMNTSECCLTGRQKDLPVMDAFDIESFFDTLDCGELLPASSKVYPAVSGVPAKKPDIWSEQAALVKQEPIDAELTKGRQNEQLQKVPSQSPVQQVQPARSQMDPTELEELLSFFSGDMTATQFDLTQALLAPSSIKDEVEVLVESVKAFADSCGQQNQPCGAGHLNDFLLFHRAGLECPQEEFSPGSGSDMSSDVNSDLSGDEESGSEEQLDVLMQPLCCRARHGHTEQPLKHEGGERHDSSPSFSPSPVHYQTPQDVPGICEEDELYQLNKLLSSMASNSGMMLSEEPQ